MVAFTAPINGLKVPIAVPLLSINTPCVEEMMLPSLLKVVSVNTLLAAFCTDLAERRGMMHPASVPSVSYLFFSYSQWTQQFLGIGESCLRNVTATEHLGNFLNALLAVEFLHLRDGAILGFLLQHLVVMATLGCYLWQVGDGDTCRFWCPISAMMSAIFSAILPLTPVSISSKMIVGNFTAPLIIAFSESITGAVDSVCSRLFNLSNT